MAKRPVFIPQLQGPSFVREIEVEFTWFPGFSLQQKQLSIDSLHKAAKHMYGLSHILEISSKSPDPTGRDLSAFNLTLTLPPLERPTAVEAAFQGSKVFEDGGPYKELCARTAREAKRDVRLKESGALRAFQFGEKEWPLDPKTAFYDWLYLNALWQHQDLTETLLNYKAFTDIEFNPQRSINCQARSAALYVALTKRKLLDDALLAPESYLEIVFHRGESEPQQSRFPFLADEV